jgi:hypothetical protein
MSHIIYIINTLGRTLDMCTNTSPNSLEHIEQLYNEFIMILI